MKKAILLSTITAAFFISGCSTIMPYDSEFTCNKGPGKGVCGSMSEVYKKTLPADENNMSALSGSVVQNRSVMTQDTEQEEVMYALYRKEKNHDIKNVEQDERLARLEMQSKLLIASNSNMASKIADIPTGQASQPYPVYPQPVVDNNPPKKQETKKIVKKKIVKTCHVGNYCKPSSDCSTINIREKPCQCSEVVGYIEGGKTVKIIDEKNGWVKTDQGWSDGRLLKRSSGKVRMIAKEIEKPEVANQSVTTDVVKKTSQKTSPELKVPAVKAK